MNTITFNPDKHVLGNLCTHEHDWEGTGQSLRYKLSTSNKPIGKCVQCNKNWKPLAEWIERTRINFPELDIESFYAGILCKRQHRYKNQNYSLRYTKSGACVECYRDRKKNDPVYIEIMRSSAHKRRQSEKGKAYEEAYRRTEARRESLKRWNSSEKKRIVSNRYLRSEKGKIAGVLNARKRRARKQNNHAAQYTKQQVRQLFGLFDNCCAYCGSIASQIDHAIAIANGGPEAIGNLLPACRKCNLSKSDKDLEQWYRQQTSFTVKRWRKILKVLGLTESTLGQLPLF